MSQHSRRAVVAAVAAAATLLAGGSALAGGGATAPTPGLIAPVLGGAHANAMQSSNWAGYSQSLLRTGTPFQSVTGTWVVPKATQHVRGSAENSSAWIGIGGGCLQPNCLVTDLTLIQVGTESDVDAKGRTSYGAWFELIPTPSTAVPVAVHPGDRVSAAIRQAGLPGMWTLSLVNRTTGAKWSTTMPYLSTYGTAEWIVETPLIVGVDAGFASLPKLTETHFDNATVNGKSPHFGADQQVFLVDNKLAVIARPSSPQKDGNGFGVCTYAASCRVPGNF